MERWTRQRDALTQAFAKAGRPLTREELLAWAQKELPTLGKATVDRFIREQRAAGKLIGLDYPGQPIRFQIPTGQPRPHFICRSCDRVYELDAEEPSIDFQAPKGFVVTAHEVVLYGTCPSCSWLIRRDGTVAAQHECHDPVTMDRSIEALLREGG